MRTASGADAGYGSGTMPVSSPSDPVARAAGVLRSPRRVLPVALPALALVVAGLLLPTGGYFLDLDVYRLAVLPWLDGADLYRDLPPTAAGIMLPFIYPPFAAMVLTPLVLLPWTASWIALLALSVASLGVTLYVVARRVRPGIGRAGALAVASASLPLALLLEPVRETVWFGQINLLLMALVAVDCLAEKPRWPRGLLVGLAAAIKLTPAAFVLYFLLRRDTRAAAVAAVTALAATGAGFAVDAGASVRYWFGGPAAEVRGSVFHTNQTFSAVLARAGLDETAVTVGSLSLAAGLLVLVVPVVRRTEPALALVVVAGFALLASPTSWSHHWVWAAPALVVAAASAVRRRSPARAAFTALLVVAFTVPPFRYLPRDGGRELAWSAAEQVAGAAYVIVAVVLLVLLRGRLDRVR